MSKQIKLLREKYNGNLPVSLKGKHNGTTQKRNHL
jgi:hypothetical protein